MVGGALGTVEILWIGVEGQPSVYIFPATPSNTKLDEPYCNISFAQVEGLHTRYPS